MKIFKLFFVIYLISSFNHLEASNDDVKSKITKNNLLFNKYLMRFDGLLKSMMGKKSNLRP